MKLTVKNDELLAANYTFPGPNGGLFDNRTGQVITAENVKTSGFGYLPRHSVESAVIRHNNRKIREAKKQPVTSQKKRRELHEVLNAVREEKKRKKEEREAAKQENIEFFKRLDSSNTNYKEKVAEVMAQGKHQKVGAMVRYSIKKGVPVAYVDRYGYYMTMDGITWMKLQDYREDHVRYRSPANRHSRGECMILIPIREKPEQKSRLIKSRLSITGWTEAEFKIAKKAVEASREDPAAGEVEPVKKQRRSKKAETKVDEHPYVTHKREEAEREDKIISLLQSRYEVIDGVVITSKSGEPAKMPYIQVANCFVHVSEVAKALSGEVPAIAHVIADGESRYDVDDRLNGPFKLEFLEEKIRRIKAQMSTNS